MSTIRKKWCLKRYARFVGSDLLVGLRKPQVPAALGSAAAAVEATAVEPPSQPNQTKQEEWKFFSNDTAELVMALTNQHHLVVTYGKSMQENMSLWNSQMWMKATQKGDSVLLVYACKDESRRFRVKFADNGDKTAVSVCNDWVDTMQAFFPIKQIALESQTEKPSQPSKPMLEGDVAVGKIAEVLAQKENTLPRLYNGLQQLPTTELSTLIKLCLSDVNFPAFVGQVEEEMANIVKDMPQSTNKQ